MAETTNASVNEAQYVVEEPRRLSESLIWKIQRNFFEQKGAAAWGDHIVPFYITTNPFIANAYAQVVFGFMRDVCAAAPALDLAQPIYLIELAAGSGRFAFNFLNKFTASFYRSVLKDIPFKYVMTDLAEKNLEFWDSHPALQPFVAGGVLDFALFDAEHPAPLTLRHSGEVLAPGAVQNPLMLIANYFFDSIPQDAFYIEDGRILESCLKLASSQPEPDLNDPGIFKRVTLVYSRYPTTTDYYDDVELNRLLESYRQELNETALDFPNVALGCIRFFRELAQGRLLLLTGDKGYHRAEDLAGRQEPGYSIHGSFSMMVNYHAIGQYVRNQGGQALETSYRNAGLNVLAYLLGEHPTEYAETRQAFDREIEKQGPDDFFAVRQGMEQHLESLKLEQILAYLRFSGWDSHLFSSCFPTMLDQVGSAEEHLKAEVHAAVQQIWDNYYHLGEEPDLVFNLGMLLYKIGEYAEALEYFERSLQRYGPAPSTYYNLAACHYRLHDMETALEFVEQSLALNPEFDLAQKLEREIESERRP